MDERRHPGVLRVVLQHVRMVVGLAAEAGLASAPNIARLTATTTATRPDEGMLALSEILH